MLRGEFVRGDGLVIPNNITLYGARTILAAALRNEAPTFFVGLVDAAPDPELLISQVVEPSMANGYARKGITRDAAGWPIEGNLNGEPYFESDWMIWAAAGGNFDKPIRRMMLVQKATNVNGDATDANLRVIALSSALPADLTITPTTLEANRKFKYRVYLR